MTEWRTSGLPKSKPHQESEEVLVTWIPRWDENLRFVSTAVYIEEHNMTTDDMNWSDNSWEGLEYCEEEDAYWIPSGWYETTINEIDDIGYIPIEGKVIAWQEMPKAYDPNVICDKKLGSESCY